MNAFTSSTRVSAGEVTAEKIFTKLRQVETVIVEVTLVGMDKEVIIRKRGDTYSCQTPIFEFTFEDKNGLKTCLERVGLAKSE